MAVQVLIYSYGWKNFTSTRSKRTRIETADMKYLSRDSSHNLCPT
jgi:hypothetical protein